MFTITLTDRELSAVILALKFWRHRRIGETRRDDQPLSAAEMNVLLARLGCGTLSILPANDRDAIDLFPR